MKDFLIALNFFAIIFVIVTGSIFLFFTVVDYNEENEHTDKARNYIIHLPTEVCNNKVDDCNLIFNIDQENGDWTFDENSTFRTKLQINEGYGYDYNNQNFTVVDCEDSFKGKCFTEASE